MRGIMGGIETDPCCYRGYFLLAVCMLDWSIYLLLDLWCEGYEKIGNPEFD